MGAIEALATINWWQFILALVVVFVAVKFIVEALDWIINKTGIETRRMKEKREYRELITETAKQLKEFKEKEAEDVRQSIIHDDKIENSVNILAEKVDLLTNAVIEMRKEADNDKMAEFKDKIGASYRTYSKRKGEDGKPYWNPMEKEMLEGLIKQYEAHGGTNSFVHSVVEPQSETWTLID